MNLSILRALSLASSRFRLFPAALPVVLSLAFGLGALAQEPAPANPAPQPAQPDTQQQQPATAPPNPAATALETLPPVSALSLDTASAVTEDQLKHLLLGRDLYLRGGYLGDAISYNEHGRLNGHAPYGSYTLCAVRIDKVRLSKHKVTLEGARYGLHFLGALPYEDPTNAIDRVKITPKKKVLKLTIDREVVVKAKKAKAARPAKNAEGKAEPAAADKAGATDKAGAVAEPAEISEADQLKASIAASPADERPVDPASVTTTTSSAHAARVLVEALNNVFATGIDERMRAAMPGFWKLYYQAAAAHADYKPADPAVLRQGAVDRKAKLLTTFEPRSNEFAQTAGVAGVALYHVVVGADGKPGEIAVARPIGFGLDESAVDSIQKATFAPALKDGQPAPVLLDLVVQFRIYSKRTAATGLPQPANKPDAPVLPGPYSTQRP